MNNCANQSVDAARDRRAVGTLLRAVTVPAWVALLSGCNWVDSTGRQPGEATVQSEPITLAELAPGSAIGLLEDRRVPFIVAAAGQGAADLDYRVDTDPVDAGALDSCAAIDGFDPARAVGTLDEACAAGADCRLEVQRDDAAAADTGELGFDLLVPALRSPIGLRLRLVLGRNVLAGSGEDGGFVEDESRELDFCFVSINEAPEANDDDYLVVEGETREVSASQGVLMNDRDDDDSGNEPLSAALVQPPVSAVGFRLDADGGFSYEAPTGLSEDLLDTFVYSLSDGVSHGDEIVATVTLQIVVGNQPPVAVQGLPSVQGEVGEELFFDFAEYFTDPESGPLDYAFSSALPSAGTLALAEDGLLSGTPGPGDAGEYLLTLEVSDGGAGTSARVALIIAGDPVDEPPVYTAGTVFDQIIALGTAMRRVAPAFLDPEGENLVYSLGGSALPTGVALDPATGVVSGRPRFRGFTRGIVVQATDPVGNTESSEPFSIRVR